MMTQKLFCIFAAWMRTKHMSKEQSYQYKPVHQQLDHQAFLGMSVSIDSSSQSREIPDRLLQPSHSCELHMPSTERSFG